MSRKAIVTGSSGFIGEALCTILLEKGYEVFGVQRKHSNKNYKNKMFHEIVNSNVTQTDFASYDINGAIVFYFAWTGVSGKLASDYKTQCENFQNAVKFMEFAKQIQCSRFVFAGTIFEYENFVNNYVEFDNSSLNKVYSYFKNITDNYLGTYAQEINIEYVSCIISNVFGPNEKSSRFVTSIINNMYENREFAISDCKQDYDFIYIADAVNEIVLCGESGLSNSRYYIGSGSIKPLKEYVEEMRNIVNPKYKLEFGKAINKPTLYEFSVFNVSRVKDELGYIIKYSFSDGVKQVLKSIKEKNGGDNTGR